jgi:adenine-specific DNA-methyltransferase
MKTGLTIDFRNKELLSTSSNNHTIPLFCPQHLKNGQVIFPIGKEFEYISDEVPSLIQQNKNYLFVKRFTSKEERCRLQCAIYLAKRFSQFKYISTQNKINFIDTTDKTEMSEKLVNGLYIIINSSLYDTYYRILNGSTQVNSTEMNTIPIPSRSDLEKLGERMMNCKNYSAIYCDNVLKEIINVKN